MFYADTVGLKTVLDKLSKFEAKFGDDFKPAPLLEKLAAEGTRFSTTSPFPFLGRPCYRSPETPRR